MTTKPAAKPIRRRTPRDAAHDRVLAVRLRELKQRLAYLRRIGAVKEARS
jgi:hypothetical protein